MMGGQKLENQKNTMAIASLGCGIVSLIGDFIPFISFFSFIIGILAIVFGAKGLKFAKETNIGKGLAIAGLVMGIIAVVMGVVAVLCVICAAGVLGAAAIAGNA